ncbi:MAG: TauD/TfdA family dioxygenase [Pseudomonadota bacterium]
MIVNRLGKHLGAEISDIDLSQTLSDAAFAEVSRAFFENQVVVFRDQRLKPEAQIAFTRRFGALEQHVRVESRLPGYPEILVVSNVLNEAGKPIGAQDAGRFWHSDLSYKREPSLLSALYAIEVPEADGRVLGDTAFASTLAAYDGLPAETQQRLKGLKNVHSYEYYRAKNRAAQAQERANGVCRVAEPELTAKALSTVPEVETPILRPHPVTDERGFSSTRPTPRASRTARGRRRRAARHAVSAHRAAGIHLSPSLACRRPVDVGQLRRPAQGHVRL